MAYSKYAIQGIRRVTLGGIVGLMGLAGVVVAVVGLAFGISSWRMFAFGCVPAAVVLALAVREMDRPCGHGGSSDGIQALFLIGLVLSLTLYAAAAFAGVIEGLRWSKAGAYGKAFSHFACPLASVLGGGLLLFAALVAALHCE
jgi:hypothetical protein